MSDNEAPLSRLAAAYESSDDGDEPLVYSHATYNLYSCLTRDPISSRSIQEKEVQGPLSGRERLIGGNIAQLHHF